MFKFKRMFLNNDRSAAEKPGSEPVKSLLIAMAIPSIVAMLMQALYNTVDSMYVARISEGSFTLETSGMRPTMQHPKGLKPTGFLCRTRTSTSV